MTLSTNPEELDQRHQPSGWERMGRDEMRAQQLAMVKDRLRELQKNEFYRRHWADSPFDVDDIQSFEDFARLVPRMTKKDVLADQKEKPPFGSLLGVERSELVDIHLTSGTSGLGQGAFGLTANDTQLGGTGYLRFWRNAGVRPGDLVILTHPVSFLAGGRLALPAAPLLGAVVYYGFGVDKRVLLGVAKRMGVSAFFGTPGVLNDLKRVAIEEGIDPRRDLPNLKAICIGLSGAPWVETIESIQDFWGVPVHENYGLTEGMSVAVSCEQGLWDRERRYPLHFMDDILFCEVVDPDTGMPVAPGEVGELTITTYRREASPVVRYRTGDRVTHVPHTDCPCGRPFDGIVPGEISRYDDMVKIKGTTVWPATVDDIVLSRPEVDEYRVVLEVVNEREEMIVNISYRAEVSTEDRAAAADAIKNEMKVRTMVTPRLVEVQQLEHFDFKARRWTDRRGETNGSKST